MQPQQLLEQGVADGLHLGAQLHVTLEGETVVDFACGEARPGIAMQTNSIVQWYSSGKPLTAILIAQLFEQGRLQIDDAAARFLPEFAANGKEQITIRHLLTHTAGIRTADKIPADVSWNESIRLNCESPLEAEWIPGQRAGYSMQAAWFILAEIIQRLVESPFDEYIKANLLDPLGMSDSWLRLPFERFKGYGDRIAFMYNAALGRREPSALQDAAGMAICRPGGSARGPVREIAQFYAMLLEGGNWNGERFLKPETIQLFTTRHRTGILTRPFMHKLDFGFGFMVDSNRYGPETVPYGYGRRASEVAFGHSGAQSSCAFADPKHRLVVAWVTNGMPGERAHQTRQRELNSAIYESLGME